MAWVLICHRQFDWDDRKCSLIFGQTKVFFFPSCCIQFTCSSSSPYPMICPTYGLSYLTITNCPLLYFSCSSELVSRSVWSVCGGWRVEPHLAWERERCYGSIYHLLGLYHLAISNKWILNATSTCVLCRGGPAKATCVAGKTATVRFTWCGIFWLDLGLSRGRGLGLGTGHLICASQMVKLKFAQLVASADLWVQNIDLYLIPEIRSNSPIRQRQQYG